MKIVKILGGFGNQMFQFCYFLYLKKKHIDAKLDISEFNKYKLHYGLELDRVFGIIKENNIALRSEILLSKDQFPFFKLRKIIGKVLFKNLNYFIKKTHWIEPNYSKYYDNIHKFNHTYLDGYWQNEKYLFENESEIKHLFHWKFIDFNNLNLANKMQNEESVSVHIRRLDSPHSLNQLLYSIRIHIVWRIATKEYYINAINYLNEKTKNPSFYIFTDNISWVRKNIPLNKNYTIIDWNRGIDSHKDMFLMTHCKHNIISMSTFSWWGAWLNLNENKIIIAPKKWAPRFVKINEIIPKNWIRL